MLPPNQYVIFSLSNVVFLDVKKVKNNKKTWNKRFFHTFAGNKIGLCFESLNYIKC